MIYLDNAATTKMDKKALDIFKQYACEDFYNPSANYGKAVQVSKALKEAREIILEKLGLKGDIIFTSGATEANNLAIRGSFRRGDCEYVFSAGEHPSVYNVAQQFKNEGVKVIFVPLQKNGQIDYQALEKSVNEKTRLISVMHVSNETGAVNDLSKIDFIRKSLCPKALFHVDGVQGFCKMDLCGAEPDFYTISAHKIHGPKGVGALYVKNKNSLKPIVYGGGQEDGLRSGTENVASIMAMAEVVKNINVQENLAKVKSLYDTFIWNVNYKNITILETESPYIISLSFKGVNGETLMRALESEVVVGMGSACSAKKAGNRVLKEIGYSDDMIKSSLRVSFSADQSEEEVKLAAQIIKNRYLELLERVK